MMLPCSRSISGNCGIAAAMESFSGSAVVMPGDHRLGQPFEGLPAEPPPHERAEALVGAVRDGAG